MKPGYRTSEFWLTVIATLWQLLNLSGVWDFVPNVVSLGAAVTSIAAYIVSRGLAKRPVVAVPLPTPPPVP
jgi:hypothetical protein